MRRTLVRILVVDDFEPWRRRVCTTLRMQTDLQIVAEASDGLEAVHKAQELQPDLILVDIGLPSLSGIEAARRMREYSPQSRILVVSEHKSRDIVEGALCAGADGYVVKSVAARDLLPAIRKVLQGSRFVSATVEIPRRPSVSPHRHDVGFYADDRSLLDHLTVFVGASLKAGTATIVLATQSHRERLLPSLQGYGVDVSSAIEERRYVAVDAADVLSTFMVDGMPDRVRFVRAFDSVIRAAGEATKGTNQRIAVVGECADLLRSQGNAAAAIQMEKLGNELTSSYNVDILCTYSLAQREMDSTTLQRICAEHSAIHYR